MAPFICMVIDGSCSPIQDILITFTQTYPRLGQFSSRTEADGCVTSWYAQINDRIQDIRGYIFDDNDHISGSLNFFSHTYSPIMPWERIPVDLNLASGQNHCIILQIFNLFKFRVHNVSFQPISRPPGRSTNSWTLQEDETLLRLKREGWSSKAILENGGLLPGRTECSLSARAKLLRKRHQNDLRAIANVQLLQFREN